MNKEEITKTHKRLKQVKIFTDSYCFQFLCSKCPYNENFKGYPFCLPSRIDKIIEKMGLLKDS